MKRLLLLSCCFLFMTSFAMAQSTIRGNYDALGKTPPKNSLQKVVFEEFLNFGCPHCNNFHLLSTDLRKKYKDRVEFVDIPIQFKGQGDAPLRLYYVAKALGRSEEIKKALFDARFKHNVDVFDQGIVNYLARTMGMGKEFKRDAQKPEITQLIQLGEQKTTTYGVNSTPTIVLAGTLKMKNSSSMENFVESLSQTIDDLLK